MLALPLPVRDRLTVLCLGAHCDDIEIGCGGLVLALSARPEVLVEWVVFCSNEERRRECESSAKRFLGDAARLQVHAFRDGFLPYQGGAVKEKFEELKSKVSPDLILTHFRNDRHQDHRLVSELTWNTWRNHLIWEYEIPKYDGDLGAPNLFVPVAQELAEGKVERVLESYPSQRARQWMDAETLMGLMRLRGVESNSPTRYAEAFYAYKSVVGVSEPPKQ